MIKLVHRYWKRVGIALIVAIIIVCAIPLFINILFIIPAPFDFFISRWEAGYALSFYASLLSFSGAILLGAVAVIQNRKLHNLTLTMQKLQQAQFISMVSTKKLMLSKQSSELPTYRNAQMPSIDVMQLALDDFKSPQCYHIDVEFTNSSEYPIVQLFANAGEEDNVNCLLYGIQPSVNKPIYIEAKGIQCIRFVIPSISFEKFKKFGFSLGLCFVNVFDYHTKARLYINDLSTPSRIPPYTYRLAKFTDVRPKD